MQQTNLLMVGNFSSSTAYAWRMIGSCFIALGKDFIEHGNKATVCFPQVDSIPEYYQDTGIEIVEFDFNQAKPAELFKFIMERKINALYLIDKSSFSLRYALLRFAGIHCIIIHEHFSGEPTFPNIIKRLIKSVCNRIRLVSADKVIAVSNYERWHQIEIACIPLEKVLVIYNGLNISDYTLDNVVDVYKQFKIQDNKKIVFCCGRANFYKGIQILIQAADILIHKKKRDDLFFLYCGDGPDLEAFRSMIHELNLEEVFLCAGEVHNLNRILPGVDVCVSPSICQEAFGMAVIEAMAAAKPVIASRVGGMAEIIEDGVDGIYVEPFDYMSIARLIETVIDNRGLSTKIGLAAKQKVKEKYDINIQQQMIINLFHEVCDIQSLNS
jgi:glycosyltransferase involved in cell wall biosynthesis